MTDTSRLFVDLPLSECPFPEPAASPIADSFAWWGLSTESKEHDDKSKVPDLESFYPPALLPRYRFSDTYDGLDPITPPALESVRAYLPDVPKEIQTRALCRNLVSPACSMATQPIRPVSRGGRRWDKSGVSAARHSAFTPLLATDERLPLESTDQVKKNPGAFWSTHAGRTTLRFLGMSTSLLETADIRPRGRATLNRNDFGYPDLTQESGEAFMKTQDAQAAATGFFLDEYGIRTTKDEEIEGDRSLSGIGLHVVYEKESAWPRTSDQMKIYVLLTVISWMTLLYNYNTNTMAIFEPLYIIGFILTGATIAILLGARISKLI